MYLANFINIIIQITIRAEAASTTDLNDDANFEVTAKTEGGLEYRILEIKSWPSDWSNKELKCKVWKRSDETVLFESDAITLTSSSKISSMAY